VPECRGEERQEKKRGKSIRRKKILCENWNEQRKVILIIGLCILLRVYQLNIGRPPYATQYFFALDFIVHFSHYMFRPRLAAIFRWFTITKISKVVTIYSTDPLSRHV
jgi:hypothetical protein